MSEFGTEATFRGKRRVTMASTRIGASLDESHRRLDPLPDTVQGRKIVVSPKVDDDKGEYGFGFTAAVRGRKSLFDYKRMKSPGYRFLRDKILTSVRFSTFQILSSVQVNHVVVYGVISSKSAPRRCTETLHCTCVNSK